MTRHLTAVRDFRPKELPTIWDDADGRSIEWSDWEPAPRMFICPPPPAHVCSNCGSGAAPSKSFGKIVPHPGETFEVTEDVASKRVPGRFYERTRNVPAWKVWRLFASRCPDCGGTDIYDQETDTVHVPPWDDPSEVTQ